MPGLWPGILILTESEAKLFVLNTLLTTNTHALYFQYFTVYEKIEVQTQPFIHEDFARKQGEEGVAYIIRNRSIINR